MGKVEGGSEEMKEEMKWKIFSKESFTKMVDREMRKKDRSEDVDEVTWLTKGLEGWGLEFGGRTRLLIWVTKQLYRLGLIEMDDVKAVVE